MFAKLFTVASLAILAAAIPAPNSGSGSGSTPPDNAQCCSSVTNSSDPAAVAALGLVGIVLEGIDVLVGLNCSPITVVGVGSSGGCSDGTTVTCQDNSHGGLIDIGCVPVTL